MKVTKDYIQYGLGFKTEIPDGYEGIIRPRSSNSKYDLVMCNSIATMDAGYRGEWLVRFKVVFPATLMYYLDHIQASDEEVEEALEKWVPTVYAVGDKVAQICFRKLEDATYTLVGSLEESSRGEGGFGSTGK